MPLDDQQATLYKSNSFINDYSINPGVFALPVAEEPPTDPAERANWSPVVMVKAHAPYRTRTIRYTAEKEQSPPYIPTPSDVGPFRLVHGSVSIPFPSANTAGGLTWKAAAELNFVEAADAPIETGYVLGQLPYVHPLQRDGASRVSTSPDPAMPAEVSQAGIGPRVGYNSAKSVDLTNPMYVYSEASYYPAVFQSKDMVSGPSSYTSL